MPCAGNGSRFSEKGYLLPKPLIDVRGQPMIKVASESLGFAGQMTFIVRSEHVEKHNIDFVLRQLYKDCHIVEVGAVTQGAVCSVLLAKDLINNETPLMIANSDHYIRYDNFGFLSKMINGDYDAGMLTFPADGPKWSYAKSSGDFVVEVAEKKQISNEATAGVYYYKSGAEFVKYAGQMIEKDIRVNGEFYVAPVFNEYIQDGKRVGTFEVETMKGLGTPEDLELFLKGE